MYQISGNGLFICNFYVFDKNHLGKQSYAKEENEKESHLVIIELICVEEMV